MLSHLYGAIFVAAGVLALLLQRQFRAAVTFGAVALAMLVPYTVDVARHWELFQAQFHGVMAGRVTRFSPVTPLLNLLAEHKRIFRKPSIIFPSALFFAALLLGWRQLTPRLRYMATYVLFLMVALGALATRKEVRYATYFAPFEALIIVGLLPHLADMNGWRKKALAALGATFVVSGAWFNGEELEGKTNYAAVSAAAARQIPDGSWCLAPMPLLFNELPRLNLVSTLALFATDSTQARAFVASRDIKYVVAIDSEPSERILQSMAPMALIAEGTADRHRYRVFEVSYPPAPATP